MCSSTLIRAVSHGASQHTYTPPPYSAPRQPSPQFQRSAVEDFFGTIASYISSAFRLALFGIEIISRHKFASLVLAGIIGISYEGRLFYKSHLANTNLSFFVTLDGKTLPSGSAPEIRVDGQPFASGSRIGLGRHDVQVRLKDAEPFQENFWVFGAKNLGALQMESSKGSLSVMVNPSPAIVILKRDGDVVRQGDAPMKIDKLPVGNYALIVHRGEYEEKHSVAIQRAHLTNEKIDLNLGSVDLSSSPSDAKYALSGNGRQWEGKLPAKLAEVPVGDYSLSVTRNGWELDSNISVVRNAVTTNSTAFPYGSIEVTSKPTGLVVSTNGVEMGKTPLSLQELKPYCPGSGGFSWIAPANQPATGNPPAPALPTAFRLSAFHFPLLPSSPFPNHPATGR